MSDILHLSHHSQYPVSPSRSYNCSTPYEILDSTHLTILAMETELARISASAALFEVQIPDFKQLKMCRKEVRLAKVGRCCAGGRLCASWGGRYSSRDAFRRM